MNARYVCKKEMKSDYKYKRIHVFGIEFFNEKV
jgi:hypothetical protein